MVARLSRRLQHKDTLRELLRGSGISLFIQITGLGITFLSQILLAKILGAKEYGSFTYAYTWGNILFMVAGLGLGNASLRFVAAYVGQKQWGLLKGFLWRGNSVLCISSIVVAVLSLLPMLFFRRRFDDVLIVTWGIGCATLPFRAYSDILASTIRGMRRVTMSLAPNSIIRPVLLIAGLLLFRGFGIEMNGAIATGINFLVFVMITIISFIYVLKILRVPLQGIIPVYQTQNWIQITAPIFVLGVLSALIGQLDILMIGMFQSARTVGIYAAANRLAILPQFGLAATK